MIRLEQITIREFRGIRELTLTPKGKNFSACGPNGTGKSGIVDAIEFGLTGSISRLTGPGTGELSVREHGPHVDSRSSPEDAIVMLEVTLPSLKGKTATITRSCAAPTKPVIAPDTPEVRAVFEQAALHPEFVLSRREIIRYVLSEPGKRNKEVQALLRLDDVEKLRGLLQKIANACARDSGSAEREEREATIALARALSVQQLTKSNLFQAVNPHRATLGLAPLAHLDATTDLKAGLAPSDGKSPTSRVPKVQAKADLDKVKSSIERLSEAEFVGACDNASIAIKALAADAALLDGLSRQALLNAALEHFDEKACPVCDTAFDPEEFRAKIAEKLQRLEDVAQKRVELEGLIEPVLDLLEPLKSDITTVTGYGARLAPAIDTSALASFGKDLSVACAALDAVLPLEACVAALEQVKTSPELGEVLRALEAGIAAIPEPSAQDAARDALTVAQERLERFRAAKVKVGSTKKRAERAQGALDVFAKATETELNDIYKTVEKKFADLYREINKDDEEAFSAQLLPSLGRLGFGVDFYGRGSFPPGAYHSEGHQDAMGLCLYLALMDHLSGEGFTLAVLDDVLMSVDAGHRREVCKVLKQGFPTTQFVLTTHDEVWLRHMKSHGLVSAKNAIHFRTWDVDRGPIDWDDHDVWTEIDGYLEQNDVRSAAALLRHFLEHFAAEACDRLRARVEFRGDGQLELGDLLPAATSEFGDLLKKARVAANAWGQGANTKAIAELEDAYVERRTATNMDQWQINAAIHYNGWADLNRQDFAPVAAAFRAMVERHSCKECGAMFRVSPGRGAKESLRCGCGNLNLNLVIR